jgi:DNA-binding transcriptional MerR regulator
VSLPDLDPAAQRILDDLPDRTWFRIGDVARASQVKSHVLRYWEKEFPLRPRKSRSGQRLYSRKDVEMVLRIKDLLWRKKYTVAGAKRVLYRPDLAEPQEDPADLPDVDALREALLQVRARVQDLRVSIRGSAQGEGHAEG